ncbi:MAG TPA: Spy/CpxP family protein refolding chaperone [Candidatus Sulfotelmatobacter sp.]|jgi:Spy/CpxP family protein refolding chaperone
MKSIRFRLMLAGLAVLLGGVFAKSQTAADAPSSPPMRGHWDGGRDGMMGFFGRALNLTDDQKTQMKAIMEKERPTLKPLHEQERQIDQQLRQYVEGTFDQAKVQALATQKAQVDSQLTVEETRVHNQMYLLLTPDQQSQLKQMEANRQARMQQHMQNAPAAPQEE